MEMLKLMKWNFINYIRRFYWLYVSFATVFIIAAVMPDDIRYFSSFSDGIGAVFSVFFYGFTIAVSVTESVSWLRKDSSQLELSSPAKPREILLSKLILSFGINISGLLLSILLWSLIESFGISNITLFHSFSGFLEYMVCVLILLVLVMFSYIAAKSSKLTRSKAKFTTALLVIFIPMLLVFLSSAAFIAIGAWDIAFTKHEGLSIASNEKLTWFEAACGILGSAAVISAGFMGSCRLFKHRFERY